MHTNGNGHTETIEHEVRSITETMQATGLPAEPAAQQAATYPHALRLVQAFDAIGNDAARLALLHLVESMAAMPAAKRKAA